jgi:hypothetical protein
MLPDVVAPVDTGVHSWKVFSFEILHQIGAVIRFREFQPQRTDLGQAWWIEVNNPIAITLENKKKLRPRRPLGKDIMTSNGGGDGTPVEPSP